MTNRFRQNLRPLVLTRHVQFLLDLAVLGAAFVLAYMLRFDFQLYEPWTDRLMIQLPMVLLLQFFVLLSTGIYSFVWRYIGLAELGPFIRSAAYSTLILVVLRFTLPASLLDWIVPLSVIVMDTVLAFGGLLALRVMRRSLYERSERARRAGDGEVHRVLLVGAGRAGVLAMREIQSRGDLGLEVVGLVDDDPLKKDMVIQGSRVLGTTRDLPELVRRHRVEQVVITIVDAPREELQRILELSERSGARVRSIPGLFEILQGKVEISRFRDVAAEDLLSRPPVDLAEGGAGRVYAGRRVLVTGAGGSIGSELVLQIARLGPERLVLVERAENALFEMERQIRRIWPELTLEACVADVGDRRRMARLLNSTRPQVVLHSAAHKHVPLMEANPGEAIKNNILATRVLGELVGEAGCERFVLISTDKAVHPTSIMGASKRVAELVIQNLDLRHATRFLAVRFGNVLGSAGSVIPIFREQIARGGPVTVTHQDMQRYFMTIPEAAQLVLEAGAMGEGGEIFILDMGQPVRILDLARKMIRLSGLEPEVDIPIEITGPRPGEKLFEELEIHGEAMAKTRHPKIFIGRLTGPREELLEEALARLEVLAEAEDSDGVREVLAELLPEAELKAKRRPAAPTLPTAG